MIMKDSYGEEEPLNLSLAIMADPGVEKVHRKRKRKVHACKPPLNNVPSSYYEGCEGKIFKLLQLREEMLKLDHHKRKGVVLEDGKGLHLIHLLLITATSVDENNVISALDNLAQLYQTVSLTGDSVQRVVAYFADSLLARLLTRKSPFYDMIMKEPTIEEEFLAFTCLYRASPYYQFAHFTANQAIIEAFEKEEDVNNRTLHVIDFDVSYGFQWPSLIQSLSEKATTGNRISLRLTGFTRSLAQLQETESRLVSFAKGFRNLVFEFQGLLRGSKLINLRKKKNETVAVNLVFHLNTLNKSTKVSETLKSVHSLRPSIVVLVEQEGSGSPRSFLSRFMESLHYFAAMFDSLDDCLPLESAERLSIEKKHLGKEIKSVINFDKDEEDSESFPSYEKMETWKNRMESHGFEGMKLSSKCLIQAKLLLKITTHYSPLQCEGDVNGGFRVFERDEAKALSLGWQDRCLLTASAWQCA
ncbi:esterase/lipase/thioesterase family protein [Hibiscus syriacus]|uniref:Esterase/lipase/thioesterase family protein n=1 Tax=Hibiscus syriacus TaxID=106335 RepID=A0A6A2XAW0_HIBSY|nr:GRAS family protein RAM1-like [Hibiscus syriacus]KAE8666520.1 esterase/lipase/thioesterase family protein [Hibiscus syriacus]